MMSDKAALKLASDRDLIRLSESCQGDLLVNLLMKTTVLQTASKMPTVYLFILGFN